MGKTDQEIDKLFQEIEFSHYKTSYTEREKLLEKTDKVKVSYRKILSL